MEGPFTFETLSNQESLEKKSRTLTKIEASFFRRVNNYLEQLEAEYAKEQAKNPSSKRAAFLIDELRNATNKAEEFWKAREKKIVQYAQVAARKDPLPPPPENLMRDEAGFYEAILKTFGDQWRRLLPQRNAALPTPVQGAPRSTEGPAPTVHAPPTAPAPAMAPTAATKDEVQTIRALVDIPPFVGFDGKTYRIKKGEVLTLPKKFAAILKDRNQAAWVG